MAGNVKKNDYRKLLHFRSWWIHYGIRIHWCWDSVSRMAVTCKILSVDLLEELERDLLQSSPKSSCQFFDMFILFVVTPDFLHIRFCLGDKKPSYQPGGEEIHPHLAWWSRKLPWNLKRGAVSSKRKFPNLANHPVFWCLKALTISMGLWNSRFFHRDEWCNESSDVLQ